MFRTIKRLWTRDFEKEHLIEIIKAYDRDCSYVKQLLENQGLEENEKFKEIYSKIYSCTWYHGIHDPKRTYYK